MRSRTKLQLIATVLLLLIAVAVTFYATYPRQKYMKIDTLKGITIRPVPPSVTGCVSCPSGQVCAGNNLCLIVPPVISFEFSASLPPDIASDKTALLKSFVVDPSLAASNPALSSAATDMVNALVLNGGVPFAPELTPMRTEVTTNSVPAALQPHVAALPPDGISFGGTGEMWFALPPRAT